MFNKLFKPKSPVQITPEPGSTYHVRFASDAAKQPAALPELSGAVKRVAHEVSTLREVIASGAGSRPAVDLQGLIAQAQVDIQFATTAHQTYQAKARAGLIAEKALAPYVKAMDDARAVFRNLHSELTVRQAADDATASLSALIVDVS